MNQLNINNKVLKKDLIKSLVVNLLFVLIVLCLYVLELKSSILTNFFSKIGIGL